MKIRLTNYEIMTAATIGVMRHLNNLKAGRQHKYGGDPKQGWQYDIEGAMGECALAKAMGVYWSNGQRGARDVGRHEVRTTPGKNNKLILHRDDLDDVRYYLVTGFNGAYVIRGWILGSAGKSERFWADPGTGRPAFFVPQHELTPIAR